MKNRLKHWRHRFEMNQKQFAEYLGVDQNLYTKWELNKKGYGQPNVTNLHKLWQRIHERFPDCNMQDLLETE